MLPYFMGGSKVVPRASSLSPMILFMAAIALPPGRVEAVSNPARLPLNPKGQNVIDPELARWLAEYAESKSADELSIEEILEIQKNLDPISAALLELEWFIKSSKDSDRMSVDVKEKKLKLVSNIGVLLRQEAAKAAKDRHVLSGLLFDESTKLFSVADMGLSEEGFESKILDAEPVYSCTQKSRLMRQISKKSMTEFSDQKIHEIIELSAQYDSLSHRRKLLDSIASNLPVGRRSEFVDDIRQVGGQLPLLLRRHTWLQDLDGKKSSHNERFLISRYVRNKQCLKASQMLSPLLKTTVGAEISIIEKNLDLTVGVEQCYRNQSRSSAIAFIDHIRPVLKSSLGTFGENWADFRMAYLLWLGDQNDEAQALCAKVVNAAKNQKGQESLYAKSLFTLGKILENQRETERAIDLYSEYIQLFPNGEDFEPALTSLVVNRAAKGEWMKLAGILKDYLARQSIVPLDARPIGNMSFALFWLGRCYYNLNEVDLAKEMWRRLAAEYYSTFYGALGHFILEKANGRLYELEPSRVAGFKIETLLESLTGKQRDVALRTKALLKSGQKELARCESEELFTDEKQNWDSQLMRALLLHASGSWLEAIKIYDSIPRSVRNSLPSGFERILFPRKYADTVQEYAAKVGLDPDFVFAVMRQESVFAKEATSPVGAMGLMQLMPQTAMLEFGKLPRSYLDVSKRQEYGRRLQDETGLFDPDVNITLGVHHLSRLLDIYKSPIFALTSYNASPAATLKWKKTIASDDLLAFIERIPYKETRAYVKLILRNYFYYKRWYAPQKIHKDEKLLDVLADNLMTHRNSSTAVPN
jgi:tetratricopeptide (TPR) repeat protein